MKAIGRKAAACAAALGLTTTGGTAWAAVRALSHDDALAKLDATCTAATTKAVSAFRRW